VSSTQQTNSLKNKTMAINSRVEKLA